MTTESKDRNKRGGRTGRRWLAPAAVILAVVGLGAAVWLARGDSRTNPKRAERNEYAPVTGRLIFPPSVVAAPAPMRELYEFAARRPDLLHYLPCFCGCWRAGHKDNYDCFIDRVYPDGGVDIDEMGFNCAICEDVARVAMQMTAEGRSLPEIQEFIDQKYAAYQKERTPTPLPPLESAPGAAGEQASS